MGQNSVAKACGASLGTTNSIVAKLEQLGTLEKKPLGFRVTDPKKILIYWASIRELRRDIIYSTYSPLSVREIESQLPAGVLTAYPAFRAAFGSAPTDYEQVYIYGERSRIKRAFPPRRGKENLFVLNPDPHLKRLSSGRIAPLVQVYVDLWWLGSPAKKFVWKLDQKLERVAVEKIEAMVKREKAYRMQD